MFFLVIEVQKNNFGIDPIELQILHTTRGKLKQQIKFMAKLRLIYSFCLCYSPVGIYLLNGFVILISRLRGSIHNGCLMTPLQVFTKSLNYPYKLLRCMFLTEKSKHSFATAHYI